MVSIQNRTLWAYVDLPTGIFEILPSFLGIGESLRPAREDGARGPA